jgi:hypothetical protein
MLMQMTLKRFTEQESRMSGFVSYIDRIARVPFCRLMITLTCVCGSIPGTAQDQSESIHAIVLTDANSSFRTESRRIQSTDVGLTFPESMPAWTIEKSTLHGGKQEGSELVTIDNGAMRIVVVPTRGMSILSVTKYPNRNSGTGTSMELQWNSPVKEVVHPQNMNLSSRGGLGWLDGFNEWMVRCGLESAGHPGKDEFVNNVGDKVEMDLTLHGKIGNIPASKVTVIVDRQPPYRIRLQGIVHERMFHGPKLELMTEISTVPGSNSLRISDKVLNHSASEQEFQMIYHTNFGRPLLEEGAKTLVAADKIEPMNAHAAKSIQTASVYGPPTAGFVEQVYLAYPKSDSSGLSHALIKNRASDRGVSMTWKTSQLPFFTLWKNTTAESDGYVTGLEPGTGFPFNRNIERRFGRVPKLRPGESRLFELDFVLHEGTKAVSEFEAAIAKLQGAPPRLVTEPPTIPSR